jgi:hypothetical protein
MTSNSRAQVKLTLEILISDNWGEECTVTEIHKQAKESAIQKLQELISGRAARIIGEPIVTLILVDSK